MKGFKNKEIDLIQKRLDKIWEQGFKELNALMKDKDKDIRKSFIEQMCAGEYTCLLEAGCNLTRFIFASVLDNPNLSFDYFKNLTVVHQSVFPYLIGMYHLKKGIGFISEKEMELLYINGLMTILYQLKERKYKDE